MGTKKQLIIIGITAISLLSGCASIKNNVFKDKSLNSSVALRYYNYVKKRIYYSAYENNPFLESGRVALLITILPNGEIKDVEVNNTLTNASDQLIASTVDLIKKLAPFSPFPKELMRYLELKFKIVIDYELDFQLRKKKENNNVGAALMNTNKGNGSKK